uniref:Dynein 2 intermediate chain 2 n=1 Tax=Kryptolebias marmoratus TaxID=37003 RepID=A0A3Q2ZLR2_KRYMA
RSCQTDALHSDDAGVQTRFSASIFTQTEPQEQTTDLLRQHDPAEPDPPGLLDFLRRTEDLIIRELVKNTRSHAFDGFQADWADRSQRVSCLHRLQHPSAQEKDLHVSSVSWSCTGSVIVCAYGDGDWTNEKSCVCLWNLDRQNLNPKQADLVLEVPTAVTSVCCHPNQPALIAGLYNGEVLVWDTSRTQDPVLVQTGMPAEGHREPVYQRKAEFGVLSSSSGGRVLLWTVDLDRTRLVLDSGYAFIRQQVPHSGRTSMKLQVRGSSTVGVTAVALSPWDPDTFLVGSEGGLLLRCSFSSRTPAAVPAEDRGVVLRAPAVFSFRPSSGPVHSIHCSPFHNLFASAGTDGLVHIHSLLQADPVLSVRVSDSYLFQAQWSPSRPLVFAAATGHPVQFFDLACRALRPAATIEDGAADRAATCLAFNHQNRRLVAVGKSDGSVGVWQLSSDLVDPGPTETAQLEQIANQVSD